MILNHSFYLLSIFNSFSFYTESKNRKFVTLTFVPDYLLSITPLFLIIVNSGFDGFCLEEILL